MTEKSKEIQELTRELEIKKISLSKIEEEIDYIIKYEYFFIFFGAMGWLLFLISVVINALGIKL